MARIEDLLIGHEVFTHRGRWQPISRVIVKGADTVRVQCGGLATGLVTTADQLLRVRTGSLLLANPGGDGMSAASWVKAGELTDRHHVGAPIDLGSELQFPALPAALVGADPVDVLRTAGTMIGLRGAAADAVCPELVGWMHGHFGPYGAGRRFPAWILTAPREQRAAFLGGLVADLDGRRSCSVCMFSKPFMFGLRMLVCSLGYAGGLSESGRSGRRKWSLSWQTEGGRRFDRDGLRWHRALRVDRGPREALFDLAVIEDGSYVADGAMVRASEA
ncbi:hypothetical protein [Kitasatospora sp. NPDC058046]|uniref:hypothetical protein n=1 Tax=Kitasatospora sp. NPDC058046 TaxID=3346312 RepID=UPI0036D8E156